MHSHSAEQTDGSISHSGRFSALIVYVLFFAVLNESVFNVSIPQIAEEFQLLPSEVSWMITSFIVTFGIGQTIFAKLSDRYEIGSLMMFGLLIYMISGLIGFLLQQWFALVIIVRAIQGIGASAIKALTLVAVARHFSTEYRAKLFGIFISVEALAVAAGPILGGYVTSILHWSLLLLIPMFLLPAIPLLLKLPKMNQVQNHAKVDLLGAGLLSISIGLLMLFFTEWQWYYLWICLLAASAFIIRIKRVENPFVETDLFCNIPYVVLLGISFILFGIMMSMIFIIPIMLSALHQLPTDRIGIVMFPGAICSVFFGVIAGRLTARRGHRIVFYSGFLLTAMALIIFSLISDQSIWYICGSLALFYVGIAYVQTALAETITRTLPVTQVGAGMGFYGLTVGVAGAVGTAFVSSLLNAKTLLVRIIPFIQGVSAHLYSNLFLILFVLMFFVGIAYSVIFGIRKGTILKRLN
ncbi:tetracycline efflux MFS transporter Tet(L) [Siminovitchia terrae]|uniref:Tetracycline resistance protein n=1 Tax=Siminovitchia terrae TaxID=1914933 RepID=A0ABQ4KVD2_SIMTE|nr:MFS transporter [Siminovitchia terrae]GIN95961.1 tetracycline efflux MFS transporter Tet(L) [Siminovitchia terrae]